MRVAALYDVHGNLPALEAVLADPRCATADVIVMRRRRRRRAVPGECLERLRELGERVRFLRGNGDREIVARPDAATAPRWCARSG